MCVNDLRKSLLRRIKPEALDFLAIAESAVCYQEQAYKNRYAPTIGLQERLVERAFVLLADGCRIALDTARFDSFDGASNKAQRIADELDVDRTTIQSAITKRFLSLPLATRFVERGLDEGIQHPSNEQIFRVAFSELVCGFRTEFVEKSGKYSSKRPLGDFRYEDSEAARRCFLFLATPEGANADRKTQIEAAVHLIKADPNSHSTWKACPCCLYTRIAELSPAFFLSLGAVHDIYEQRLDYE